MTTCPRCGGPQIQLFTGTACRDECDLKPKDPYVGCMINGKPIKSYAGTSVGLAQAPTPAVYRRTVMVYLTDYHTNLPLTGLTTASLSFEMSGPTGWLISLAPGRDFDLVEHGGGHYAVMLVEKVPHEHTGKWLTVGHGPAFSCWRIQ